MENEELSTRDKILQEAINLIAEKGFKSTSVKAIADNAGVSEMTVFRYFKTKTAILDQAIEQFSFEIPLRRDVEDKIVWDLEKDLLLISNVYHKFVKLNEKVLTIKIKEGQKIFDSDIIESPNIFRDFLANYFSRMHELGKIREVDSKKMAVSFISINFGYFCAEIMPGAKFIDISLDDFIKNNISLFARGLLL